MENCCYGRDEMMAMHMVHQACWEKSYIVPELYA